MKGSTQAAPLKDALQILDIVTERRNTIPILSNVRMVARRGGLTLTATDLDTDVTAEISGDGVGDTTVPTAALARIADTFDGDVGFGTVAGEGVPHALELECGGQVFALNSLPACDFPEQQEPKKNICFKVAASALLGAIATVEFAISREETRFYLNGIYMHVADGALRLVATDGHRLAYVDLPMPLGAEKLRGVIVPRKAVAVLKAIAEQVLPQNGRMEVTFTLDNLGCEGKQSIGPGKLIAACAQYRMLTKLIDGSYPEYPRVIPRETGNRMTVRAGDLRAALERAYALSRQRGIAVTLACADRKDDDTLPIVLKRAGEGWHRGLVPASFEGTLPNIGFNIEYLLRFTEAVPAASLLTLEMTDAASPCRIRIGDNDRVCFVLMPIRV